MKSRNKISKKSFVFIATAAIAAVTYAAFAISINRTLTAYVNLDDLHAGNKQLIAYEMPALDSAPQTSMTLPSPDNAGVRDLRFLDLSGIDLSNRMNELMKASFGSNTIWPDNMPNGFSFDGVMEMSMNPGLGIRGLHERGITGKGIGIAVIDFNLLASHEQYKDRLRLYELYRTVNQTAVMHSAVASIATGKDTGVAPGSNLYYIATMYGTYLPPFTLTNYNNLVTSINRILEINAYLPENEKIRVISISRAFREYELGGSALKQAIDDASNEGVFVITCSPEINFGFQMRGLGRIPDADPDELSSYETSILDTHVNSFDQDTLLVPIDSRTVAGYTGDTDYIFYRRGGYSWGTPWLAGVYALCAQVYPDITPELFVELALATGDDYLGGKIVNPSRLVEQLSGSN